MTGCALWAKGAAGIGGLSPGRAVCWIRRPGRAIIEIDAAARRIRVAAPVFAIGPDRALEYRNGGVSYEQF